MELNFGNYTVEWKVRLGWQQGKLAASGKNKNGGGGRTIDEFRALSRRWRQRAEPEVKGEKAKKCIYAA